MASGGGCWWVSWLDLLDLDLLEKWIVRSVIPTGPGLKPCWLEQKIVVRERCKSTGRVESANFSAFIREARRAGAGETAAPFLAGRDRWRIGRKLWRRQCGL